MTVQGNVFETASPETPSLLVAALKPQNIQTLLMKTLHQTHHSSKGTKGFAKDRPNNCSKVLAVKSGSNLTSKFSAF
jgi:hypothetical protein